MQSHITCITFIHDTAALCKSSMSQLHLHKARHRSVSCHTHGISDKACCWHVQIRDMVREYIDPEGTPAAA